MHVMSHPVLPKLTSFFAENLKSRTSDSQNPLTFFVNIQNLTLLQRNLTLSHFKIIACMDL